MQGQTADSVHRLGAIEKRKAFLRLQSNRRQAGATQGFAAFKAFVAERAFPLAGQSSREVSKRGEVTARAYRSLFRDNWVNAAVQHFDEQLDDFDSYPA